MKKISGIGFKISRPIKELWQLAREVPVYCAERLSEISKVCELQNKVAALSDSRVAEELMCTIKHIAHVRAEPNHETYCMYLEEAIKDLLSGMDAVEMLWKYDNILLGLINKDKLEKVNTFLKEVHWYKQCNKNKGDKCEHSRCQYSILLLRPGKENCFFCGKESL